MVICTITVVATVALLLGFTAQQQILQLLDSVFCMYSDVLCIPQNKIKQMFNIAKGFKMILSWILASVNVPEKIMVFLPNSQCQHYHQKLIPFTRSPYVAIIVFKFILCETSPNFFIFSHLDDLDY